MIVKELLRVFPSIEIGSNLVDAAEIMLKYSVDSVVVLEGRRPVGILSSFEVLEKFVEGAKLDDIPVKDVMNHGILTIDSNTSAEEASEIMLSHRHWMAIVTENGEYKGVVTAGGLLKDFGIQLKHS
jgi:CBS domain-containing protein